MINPNEPAFPCLARSDGKELQVGPSSYQFPGLTIREHFAIMALQGLLANPAPQTPCDDIAEEALDCADALIARLNKPTDAKPMPSEQALAFARKAIQILDFCKADDRQPSADELAAIRGYLDGLRITP